MPTRQTAASYGPLRPADLFILLVLSEQDLHGYGIMKAVRRLSDDAVRVEVGSLYRLIARMIDAGLIAEVEGAASGASSRTSQPQDDSRRRYYRITPAGRRDLKAELARLKSVVALAPAKRVFEERGKAR